MKRSPLKRRTPLKRGGRLAPMSPKRRSEARQRREVLIEVARRDGERCWAQVAIAARPDVARHRDWPITCAGPVDGHEVQTRARRPGGHLDPTNIRLVCRRHHEWIDTHQVTALTLGLLSNSWDRGDPDATPHTP